MPFEIIWKNIVEPDGPSIGIRRTTDVICRADNQSKYTNTHPLHLILSASQIIPFDLVKGFTATLRTTRHLLCHYDMFGQA